MNKYSTINSFSQSVVGTQIASYIVFVLQSVVCYVVIVPGFASYASLVIVATLFSISLGVLVVSTAVTSWIDPSDEVMVHLRNDNRSQVSSLIPQCFYCDYCRSYVKQQSKHCRSCQRCVQDFDHHCMWINNCVGSKNYRYFFIMIVATWLNLAIYLAAIIILSVQNQWKSFLWRVIVGWIVSIPVAVFWFLLSNLIILHLYLNYYGLTTYQFLVAQKSQKQRQQENKKKKLTQKKQNMSNQIVPQLQAGTIVSINNINPIKVEQSVEYAQVQMLPDNSANNTQNFKHIVFGERQATQKSVGQVSNQSKHHDKNQSQQSIKISQFFTKNKSLKLIIGATQINRPMSSKQKNDQEIHKNLSGPQKKIRETNQKQLK